VILLFAVLFFLHSPQSLTVDEIVHRHVDAIGGMTNLESIQTVRRTERVEAGPEFVIMRKRGNKFRTESLLLAGKTLIWACDGQHAWSMITGQDPKPANKDFCDTASDIDGSLVNYKQKGHHVELIGKELAENREAYHLKLTDRGKPGGVHFYLDTQTFFIIKLATEDNGQHREQTFTDYRTVNGTMVAFSSELRWWKMNDSLKKEGSENAPGKEVEHNLQVLEKIEVNISLEDSLFKMPAMHSAGAARNQKKR